MRRKITQWLFVFLTGLCAVCACAILLLVLYAIFDRGWHALSWRFFTEQIRLVGADGGIFHNIIGTLILIVTAFLFSAPIATALALMQEVYWKGSRKSGLLSTLLAVLNGMPSILFGVFGMIVFVQWMNWGKSWLTGGLLLGLMILPTVTVALAERIAILPARYLEAAAGLGLTVSQRVRSVILPQCGSGLITGSLLGLARAAGETAPIMFTATIFAGAGIPSGIRENPVLSLPYHIFILSQDSFDPQVGSKVWATTLTLLFLVFAMSLIALPARLRVHEEARAS